MPNISGTVTATNINNTNSFQGLSSCTGAFYINGYGGTHGFEWYHTGLNLPKSFGFDASRLYNGTKYRENCNDVSVNSYVVYIWIRTA